MSEASTLIHLTRHGQVHNPEGVLYGRLPNFHLSDLGRQMADRVAEFFAEVPLTHLRVSPLERARETMEPIAARHPHLEVVVDDRVIEADSRLEGRVLNGRQTELFNPRLWPLLLNPLRPSWGEAFTEIVARMGDAIVDAALAAGPGGQAVIVSHQLPIYTARNRASGRRLAHNPMNRQCTLTSVTTLSVSPEHVIEFVSYQEPSADLLPKNQRKGFVAGA